MRGTKGVVLPIGYDITDAQKAIKDLDKETRSSFKELREIDKSLKFNPDNTELLTQKMDVLGTHIGTTKEKLELLKKAQEEASKNLDTKEGQEAYRKLSREIIETESKLEMYNNRLKKTEDAINPTIDKIDKMAESLEKSGDKFKKTGERMEKVGGGLTKGLTAPILGIGGAAMLAWNDVDEAVDGIIAGTGATGDAAKDLEKSFKNVARNVPNDVGDVGVALANLNTQFGLQGEALEEATTMALKYADVNGVDVGNAVNTVGKIMKAAGEDAGDFNVILSKLTAASQDSGVSVDELTGLYEKNGSTLRGLGYDFDDSISMMAQWEANGLNSQDMLKGLQKYMVSSSKDAQKLSDAFEKETKTLDDLNIEYENIKNTKGKTKEENEKLRKKEEELSDQIAKQKVVVEESGKVFQDSTMANKDEFNKLVESIKSGKDPQDAMNTAIEVFGTKNGPAFIDAIQNGKLSFEDFADTVSSSEDRLSTTWDDMQDPVDSFKTAMNDLKITGSELGGGIQEAAIPLIEEFADKVKKVGEWFSSLTDDEKENIIQMGLLLAAAGPVITIMGKLAGAVGSISTASGKAVKGISGMFKEGGLFSATGKMAGMAGPVGIAAVGVGLLTVAISEAMKPQREYRDSLVDMAKGVGDFSDMVENAEPLIRDFNEVSTQYDKTIAEKKSQIAELEPQITTILADNVEERTALTDKEMEKLLEYMGLLDTLNEEIAKKYEVQLKVQEKKLQEEDTLNREAAARYIATFNEADKELTKNAEDNHLQKLVVLESMLENEANLRAQGKTKEADEERKHYEELKAEADRQRNLEIAEINVHTADRLVAVKDRFVELNKAEFDNLREMSKIADERAEIERKYADEIKKISDDEKLTLDEKATQKKKVWARMAEDLGENNKKQYGLLDENTKDVSSALVQQVANIILHGGEIDEESAKMVDTFMKNMAETPKSAEEFKKAMEDSINAIVENEPELTGEGADLVRKFNKTMDGIGDGNYDKGKSAIESITAGTTSAKSRLDKAAQDIKDSAQRKLRPNEANLMDTGKSFASGVAKGMNKYAYLVENSASKMAGRAKRGFDEKLSIHSPSREMMKSGGYVAEGVAVGIDKESGLVEKSMQDLAKIPKEISWTTDPMVAGDFKRASQTRQMINNYPVINVNNPQLDSMDRVRKLAEELYRLQTQRR